MITVKAEEISSIVSHLVIEANRYLSPDLVRAIEQALEKETGETARFVLGILLENAAIAMETGLPVCQDTGIDVVFIEQGSDVMVQGNLESSISEGIASGTGLGLLRTSVCDPLTRQNTGDNTPPVVHTAQVEGKEIKISVLPKGCGSENMSSVSMLPPSAGTEGIIDAVVEQVRKAGPNPCPPGIIGVGIGGTMEKAALISKMALLRPVGRKHDREDVSAIEREIKQRLAESGIGPMGLGGRTTVLGVHAEVYPCHIASLPVAVNIQCHAARYAWAKLENGSWTMGQQVKKAGVAPRIRLDMPVTPRRIHLPLDREVTRELRAGEWVLLTGSLYTGRDQTHRRLVELLEAKETLPVNLDSQMLYYTGPSPAPPGRIIGSAGPTTSYRMDAYTPDMLDQGVLGLMGKGKRSLMVRKAIKKHAAVYFATIGGAGAYLSDCITDCKVAAFPELGPEALYRLEVENFPAVVINDAHGNDHYGQAPG